MNEIIGFEGDTVFKSDAAKIPDFKTPSQSDTGWGIKNDTRVEDKQLYGADSAKIPDFKTSKNLDPDDVPNIDTNADIDKGIEKSETRNQNLEGGGHPKTGVPFVRIQITLPSGEVIEGVFPVFDSQFDAQLPDELLEASDKEQFNESNKQLKEWVKDNPGEAKEKFTKEQLEDIDKERTPEGYSWHHNEEPGKMQLVDSETHAKTGHTGGNKVWGSGSDNR